MNKFLKAFYISTFLLGLVACASSQASDPAETPAPITVVAIATVNPGKLDETIAITEELAEHTKATEPGALSYQWFLSEDKTVITVIETYKDSEAVLFHGQNYQPFAERLNKVRTATSIDFYGNLSPELKAAIDAAGFNNHTQTSGFVR